MTWFSIAALAAFAGTLVYLWFRVSQIYKLTRTEAPSKPKFRHKARQMYVAVGLWQISVALVLIAAPATNLATVIPLFGVGMIFLAGSWVSVKFERVLP